jgi:hypothetical protein
MFHNMSHIALILSLLIRKSWGISVFIAFWSIWCKSEDTTCLRTTDFSGLQLATGFGLSWRLVKPELSIVLKSMHVIQTQPGTCTYYVYNQSKTGWISIRLIQMGINMLTGEILISAWFLLAWHDMESRLIWFGNFSNNSRNSVVVKTEFKIQQKEHGGSAFETDIYCFFCVMLNYILNLASFRCADRLWL